MMLDVQSLKAGYGERIILNGINFSIAAGDRISLIGHNGAGKSTILKALTGQIRPVDGQIHYLGKRIDRSTPEDLVKVGIVQVPAGRRIFPHLTVRQNMEVGAFTRNDKREIVDDLERMFVQFDVLRRKHNLKAGTMSGGEQQMLAIARALMARPKLLLVDEPSLGLSPLMVDEVFSFLAGLAQEHSALVLAEQNVRKALSVTNRAIVLSQGAIISEMSSEQLLEDANFRETYLGAA
jgi:branched-chain amino acid transport system ATP-binding protein